MSQIYKNRSTGPVPPVVPTSFVTDSGIAIPAANILNILAIDSSENNDNGITTNGSGNTVDIVLTNRATAQITTVGAGTTTIITFPLSASPAVYSITGYATLLVPATGDGASYFFDACFKTTGAAATEVGTEYPTTFEDPALATADIVVTASGNNVLLRVVGVAGLTINWDGYLLFRQVS